MVLFQWLGIKPRQLSGTITPIHSHALLMPCIPPCCLRSPSTGPLAEPRRRTVKGSHAFHASAPKEWNRLPLSPHSSNSLTSLKKAAQNSQFLVGFQGRSKCILTVWLTIFTSDSNYYYTKTNEINALYNYATLNSQSRCPIDVLPLKPIGL